MADPTARRVDVTGLNKPPGTETLPWGSGDDDLLFCPPGEFNRLKPHNHELCLRNWPDDAVAAWVNAGILDIKYMLTEPTAVAPSIAYPGDAGLDLGACETIRIPPGSTRKVEIGVAVQLPGGYCAIFMGRSSMMAKGLLISPTLIDWGFRGPLFAVIQNIRHSEEYIVHAGDRIAQLLVLKADLPLMRLGEVAMLDPSDRGVNGVGSSGR